MHRLIGKSVHMEKFNKLFIARLSQISIDALLIIFSLFLSYVLTEQTLYVPRSDALWLLRAVPLFLIVKLSINYHLRIYRQLWRYVSIKDVANIVKAVSLSSFVGVVGIFILRWPIINKTMFILDWILCIGFFSGARFLRRYLTMWKLEKRRPKIKKKRVLLYGAGESGELILRRIHNDPYIKISPVGFVDDAPEKAGAILHGVEILGNGERLGDIIEKFDVEEILITTPLMDKEKVETIIRVAKEKNVEVKIVPSFYGMLRSGDEAPLAREIDVQDLLGRERVVPNINFLEKAISGKRFLVTGGCGSIGKELVKQLVQFKPEKIVVLDINETGIFWLDYELSQVLPKEKYSFYLCDVKNLCRLGRILDEEKPEVIYHAAAYKHVPISKNNPSEYISTNVVGTKNLIELVKSRNFIKKFCLISTDKAANPSNVMGASKRLAELLVLRESQDSEEKKITFVRFGNVLGTRGSVVPIFKDMIAKGGPVKVTHPDIERYFMDKHEAIHLVLQAPFFVGRGVSFLLDMGKPVKINDLAKLVIRLSGSDEKLIKIEYVGLRPGEKISEELFDLAREKLEKTGFDRIFSLVEKEVDRHISEIQVQEVISVAQKGDDESVHNRLNEMFPNLTKH